MEQERLEEDRREEKRALASVRKERGDRSRAEQSRREKTREQRASAGWHPLPCKVELRELWCSAGLGPAWRTQALPDSVSNVGFVSAAHNGAMSTHRQAAQDGHTRTHTRILANMIIACTQHMCVLDPVCRHADTRTHTQFQCPNAWCSNVRTHGGQMAAHERPRAPRKEHAKEQTHGLTSTSAWRHRAHARTHGAPVTTVSGMANCGRQCAPSGSAHSARTAPGTHNQRILVNTTHRPRLVS